jgi:hypothetical protein
MAELSLSKIYNGLCECCAKPMKSWERANIGRLREGSQTTSTNRFAAFNPGASSSDSLSTDKQPDGQCDECAKDDLVANVHVATTPRLVDDHLGDAFGLRSEMEVHWSLVNIPLFADPGLYRK